MLKAKETVGVMIDANKDAGIDSAKIITGNIINARLAKVITPRLPMMVRGYAQSDVGQAVLANVVAGLMIHTMPENDKVMLAAESMIGSASLQLASSFNIEEMINELLDNVPGLDGPAKEK